MTRHILKRNAGLLLAVAVLWGMAGAFGLVVYSGMGAPTVVQAQSENPCNPCNPCGGDNPCNPCGGGNPCNPCGGGNPCNPCNPCGGAANPCNPCNPCGAAANPCNPCGAAANPCGAAANPCNPCGGGAQATNVKLGFGTDYMDGSFEKTTGYVSSASHGNRLVVTYVKPAAAARIYRENADKVRSGNTSNMKTFPAGTTIVKESWVKNREGGPGQKGPLFVMQKEQAGYDPSGNNWRYGFANADHMKIGEGFTGPVAFCKACHQTMRNQDFVFAVDR